MRCRTAPYRGVLLAVVFGASSASAGDAAPSGAMPSRAQSSQASPSAGPISDVPPPPARTDLGGVAEPTIRLTADAPYVAGRASLRVASDADTGGSAASARGALTPLVVDHPSYFALAGRSLTWPAFVVGPIKEPWLTKVTAALTPPGETNPANLDALADAMDADTSKAYPRESGALRAKAALLRAEPLARRVSYSAKMFFVDFASPEKAATSVVSCHVVHTGGAHELQVFGETEVVVAQRAAAWVDAAEDAGRPSSLVVGVRAVAGSQSWYVDECRVTGYRMPRKARPASAPGRALRPGAATAPSTAQLAPSLSSIAAAPALEALDASAATVTPRAPSVAGRAALGFSWQATPGSSANATIDATNDQAVVLATGSVALTVSVDVNRQAGQRESVACEVVNGGAQPLSFAGQVVAPSSSRWIEAALAPAPGPAWETVRFSTLMPGGSAGVRRCVVRAAPAQVDRARIMR